MKAQECQIALLLIDKSRYPVGRSLKCYDFGRTIMPHCAREDRPAPWCEGKVKIHYVGYDSIHDEWRNEDEIPDMSCPRNFLTKAPASFSPPLNIKRSNGISSLTSGSRLGKQLRRAALMA